ncbi:MAG: dihydropyrimidine dehydrogenase subunit A [Dehalococcoidia bacterium]|nr:MAG: dihydropyrimidine dehydrogenase subunit A [Dehalococcoidia bacterium]
MSKAIFSSWAGKIVDNRGLDTKKYKEVENLEFPLQYNSYRVKAFMSWDGLVIIDEKINVVDMAYSYLREAQKLSCGECTAGYLGMKVMLDILDRISNGEGKEEDVDFLQWLGNGIKENARCSFCASAVTPVLDAVNYYKEEFLKTMVSKQTTPKSTYITKVSAPCMEACPAHQDVPCYIELIKNYRYKDSLALIRKTNAFPHVCGRACVAFCEDSCRRANLDSPVAIRALKRFAVDYEVSSGAEPKFEKVKKNKQRIAVIGAGPAGLAASYNLALMGYQVTIYDKLPSAGGMALVGIPQYRLPKDVLSRDIDVIKRLGVEFKLNTKIGKDVTLKELSTQGFKAIFIATGAQIGRELGVEVKEEGVVDGVDFLHNVNTGKKVKDKDKVIIIGGGNVAIDCARTCLRLGFKDVTIVYRRSRAEMPGRKEEVEAAEAEGVKITFLATPVKILAKAGKVTGAECIRMELGEPDASGRRRPIPIKGSEFTIETDMIIPAIGEKPDLSFLTKDDKIEIRSDGTIKIEPSNCQTSQPWVFSGGDCATGPATLIEAIAAGNRAAKSIDQYLRLGKIVKSESDIVANLVGNIDLSEQREDVLLAKRLRQSPEELPIKERQGSFSEVEKCLTPEAAAKEAERCLRCYRLMLLAIASES